MILMNAMMFILSVTDIILALWYDLGVSYKIFCYCSGDNLLVDCVAMPSALALS